MIQRLSEETIEKIAAGEVIERPVSVVKELVENAVDAGADAIRVDIRRGGKDHIGVYDNGCGIPADELELAVQRHATSKIRDFSDLYQIHSLGFRGEALASIAAVSHLTIRSRTAGEKTGTEAVFEEGRLLSKKAVAMSPGSQMEVDDLFYNIPVRQKFLKSDAAEAGQISALMYSLAVGEEGISVRFTKDGRRIFQTSPQHSLDENLLVLFGSDYYEALLPVEGESSHYRLWGRMGNNTFYRGNRQMQYLYVNGRMVDDKAVSDQVEKEYQSVIPNGRFPAFQLFIETDPKNIDVNVHPNKRQIHFDWEGELLDLVQSSVHSALFAGPKIPEGRGEKKEEGLFSDLSDGDSYRQILQQYQWKEEGQLPPSREEEGETDPADLSFDFDMEDLSLEEEETATGGRGEGTEVDRPPLQSSFVYQEPVGQAGKVAEKGEALPPWEGLDYLGCLFSTFLLFEVRGREEALLIDQHAAHERINYEKFSRQLAQKQVISQTLAYPLKIKLTPQQMEEARTSEAVLREVGYDFSVFGETEVLLRSVPALFSAGNPGREFSSLLDTDLSSFSSQAELKDKIAMKACKASVKQGDSLSLPEVKELYLKLSDCDYPFSCPHGRPTLIQISKYELEKAFLRIK